MLEEYLNRINFTGEVKPSKEVLYMIHANHMLNIPFENLDIHQKKKLILTKENLYYKIIENTRGGYCYELNGMFYHLLKEIGFDVKMISAQVSIGENIWTQEFSHMALIVNFSDNDICLTDVGFGDNFLEPVKFELDAVQKDKAGYFKIVKGERDYFNLMNSQDGIEFKNGYRFTTKERVWEDFEEMNTYQQTSEDSHFTKNKICSKATEDGRISLSNGKLTITKNGLKEIIEFSGDDEFNKMLFKYFQIRL